MQRSWLVSSQRVDFNCLDVTVGIPKLILLTNLGLFITLTYLPLLLIVASQEDTMNTENLPIL